MLSDKIKEKIEILEKGLRAVECLINESDGVAGLRLNGDIATWVELRTGGTFYEWLVNFDEAIDLLEKEST